MCTGSGSGSGSVQCKVQIRGTRDADPRDHKECGFCKDGKRSLPLSLYKASWRLQYSLRKAGSYCYNPKGMASICRARNISTTLTPFLYHTRTLSRAYSAARVDEEGRDRTSNTSTARPAARPRYLQRHAAASAKRAAGQREREQRAQRAQRAQHGKDEHAQQVQEKANMARTITMTHGEKRVFGEILDQLERTGNSSRQVPDSSGREEGSSGEDEMSQMSSIFESVLAEFRGKKKKTPREQRLHPREGEEEQRSQTQEEVDEAQMVDISEILGDEGKRVPMERAIDIIVRRESAKIETALQDAIDHDKGDIGIWDVCRARIFSMLHDIGQTMPESRDQQSNTLRIPSTVPSKAVVISLYPKMLLVAFRLLSVHFPHSPLIHQFRSTIRSHGRASAVLGTSTALYNELIYFYWRGCSDIAGVISLLREMEVTGVEPSARTCSILQGILRQREWDLKGHRHRSQREKGRGREPWWDLAPNRRAIRDLMGPDGWLSRLEERVQQLEARH